MKCIIIIVIVIIIIIIIIIIYLLNSVLPVNRKNSLGVG